MNTLETPFLMYEDLLRLDEIFGQVRTRNASTEDLQRDHAIYIYDAQKNQLKLKDDAKEKMKTKTKASSESSKDDFMDVDEGKKEEKDEEELASSSTSVSNSPSSKEKASSKMKNKKEVSDPEEEKDPHGDLLYKDIIEPKVLLGSTGSYCTICLCEYEDKEELRVLKCKHAFHKMCIDQWISKYVNNCPICRGEGVKSERHSPSSEDHSHNPNHSTTTTSSPSTHSPNMTTATTATATDVHTHSTTTTATATANATAHPTTSSTTSSNTSTSTNPRHESTSTTTSGYDRFNDIFRATIPFLSYQNAGQTFTSRNGQSASTTTPSTTAHHSSSTTATAHPLAATLESLFSNFEPTSISFNITATSSADDSSDENENGNSR